MAKVIVSRTINLLVKRNKIEGGDVARGSKSPVAVANYIEPKYFCSDFARREMERREGGGEVKGREGSRSRIRVFAPLAQSTPPHVLAMRG